MDIINLSCPPRWLFVGYEGEQYARKQGFDFSAWVEEYGEGVLQLYFQRPGDAEPYLIVLEIEDTVAVWTQTALDAENAGHGRAQFVYRVGDVIAKEAIFNVQVEPSLGAPGTEPTPAEQAVLERMAELAAQTQKDSLGAAGSAEAAGQSADSAGGSATAAARSATDADRSAAAAEEARKHIADGVDALNDRVDSFEENLVLIQEEQPIEEDNKLWVDTDADGEITVALYEDYLALEADVDGFTENVIAVQSEEPTSEDNRLWVQTESGKEIQIPTYTEFQAVTDGIAELSGTVDTLSGTVSGVSGEVDALQNNIDALTDDVTALEAAQPKTVTVMGTVVTITAEDKTRYVCGALSTLTLTPPASGICDVLFTSGTTPTVLTANGVTWPEWFDPTDLEADTVYELNISDGYGVVATWAV